MGVRLIICGLFVVASVALAQAERTQKEQPDKKKAARGETKSERKRPEAKSESRDPCRLDPALPQCKKKQAIPEKKP
jgi:hypothetical protein